MNAERALLEHIRLAIERIETYASQGEAEFLVDTKTQDAIIRNFEIIGEAAKGLSRELRNRQSKIPWQQVAGMRDFLIHVYFGVNLERVWQTIQTDLGPLKAAIDAELALQAD